MSERRYTLDELMNSCPWPLREGHRIWLDAGLTAGVLDVQIPGVLKETPTVGKKRRKGALLSFWCPLTDTTMLGSLERMTYEPDFEEMVP